MSVGPIPPTVPSIAGPSLSAPAAQPAAAGSASAPQAGGSAAGSTAGAGFAGVLSQALSGLQGLQAQADASAQQLASGQGQDLAQAVIAAEKANLGLSLAVEVRNRAISAYQQIMQMQI
jgi:flagellar hook-basal body complex protein FliE